jgi:hypothetical protein
VSAEHPGPPLAAPAVTGAATFVASVLVGPVSGAGPVPSPFDGGAIATYAAAHPTVLSVTALLVLLSAIALVFLSAVTWSRLAFLAPNAPGPAIAGIGGVAAAGSLLVTAGVLWALGQPGVADHPDLAVALHHLGFALGGPVHVASLGVLVVGIAVTTLFVARTPRWLSYTGVALAAVDVLGSLALLDERLAWLLPVGRFLTLAWLVGICALVPRDRAARGRRTTQPARVG